MSIIKQIIVCLVTTFLSGTIFSQNSGSNDNRPFLVTANDPLVAFCSADTLGISISFYVNGYESKKKREKAIKARQDQLNKQKRRDYVRLPTFSVNYISLKKPERLSTLECGYRTLKEFNSSPYTLFSIHIIIKQNDGTYLKWSPVLLPEE